MKSFTCCRNEDDISDSSDKVKIEIIHTQNSTALPGQKTVVTSESDNNSESDSGVGSVRDSSNDSGKESMTSQIPLKIASTTVKVNRTKSVKRSESLLSRFSFIFPSGGEKLSDILVEEFKKNDRTTGIALERMFSSNSMNSIPEEAQIRPIEVTKKQLKKKKSIKQLITGKAPMDGRFPKMIIKTEDTKDDQTNESTPDVPTTPEIDLENREKKKRKKRKTLRKTIDAEESESSSSTSESNRGEKRPVMRKPSQKVVSESK